MKESGFFTTNLGPIYRARPHSTGTHVAFCEGLCRIVPGRSSVERFAQALAPFFRISRTSD